MHASSERDGSDIFFFSSVVCFLCLHSIDMQSFVYRWKQSWIVLRIVQSEIRYSWMAMFLQLMELQQILKESGRIPFHMQIVVLRKMLISLQPSIVVWSCSCRNGENIAAMKSLFCLIRFYWFLVLSYSVEAVLILLWSGGIQCKNL